MSLHTPVWVQPTSGDPSFPSGIPFSAQELRRTQQALISMYPGLGSVQRGVTPLDGQFAVTQRGAGANFSVDVASGHAFVVGGDVTAQGVYGCWSDGTTNVATPSAPGSGTEVHRLVLQIQDKFSNGTWTGYTANLNLLADTGSGTPAEPVSAITLALISITAGQASVLNANIADQRQLLFSPGLLVTSGSGQTIASTSLTVVTGLSCAVGAHTYRFSGKILWTQGATASRQNFEVVGPASSQSMVTYLEWAESSSGEDVFGGHNAVGSVLFGASGGVPAGDGTESHIDGWATFTSPGTFSVQAACSNASHNFVIAPGSFIDVVRRG